MSELFAFTVRLILLKNTVLDWTLEMGRICSVLNQTKNGLLIGKRVFPVWQYSVQLNGCVMNRNSKRVLFKFWLPTEMKKAINKEGKKSESTVGKVSQGLLGPDIQRANFLF